MSMAQNPFQGVIGTHVRGEVSSYPEILLLDHVVEDGLDVLQALGELGAGRNPARLKHELAGMAGGVGVPPKAGLRA